MRREDPILRSSRREALIVFTLWLVACVYSLSISFAFGYERDSDSLTFIVGVPDWAFWGILVPWTACTVASFWVSHYVIADEELGEERPEAAIGQEAEHG